MSKLPTRPLGDTEKTFERIVASGTAITVLGVQFNTVLEPAQVGSALKLLQRRNNRLFCRISCAGGGRDRLSFVAAEEEPLEFEVIHGDKSAAKDLSGVEEVAGAPQTIEARGQEENSGSIDLVLIELVQRELNREFGPMNGETSMGIFTARLYISEVSATSALILRLHPIAYDRVSASALLAQLLEIIASNGGEDGEASAVAPEADELSSKPGPSLEDAIPQARKSKAFWKKGLDLVGYAAVSQRHAYLPFSDTSAKRQTHLMLRSLTAEATTKLRDACVAESSSLGGVITAAGLIAAVECKQLPQNKGEHYGLTTLADCRPLLPDSLSPSTAGFYHPAMMNTIHVRSGEGLWDVARRVSDAIARAVEEDKLFTDLGDLNLLTNQAIEHPGLTPASSMRTSLLSSFYTPLEIPPPPPGLGVGSIVACASVHGVGPCIGIFDAILDGALHLAIVYPSPLITADLATEFTDKLMGLLSLE